MLALMTAELRVLTVAPLRCCRGAAGDVGGLDADFKMRGTG